MRATRRVLEKSKCHTLDRNNLRAQRDGCGIGIDNEEWRFAVDQVFNVTHWPYIQNFTNYHCVAGFFADSYLNLVVEGAQGLLTATFTIVFSALLVI